ncbi:MAG TPA: glycosyltransferase [bacterium]|nr:glycosyltransferase [bacterium]
MEVKKRILVFIPEFPVLTETFIERELEKLNEYEGIDLVIFSLKKGRGDISDSLKKKVVYDRLSFGDIFATILYFFLHFSELRKIFRELKKNGYSVKTSSYDEDKESENADSESVNRKGKESDEKFSNFYIFFKSVAYSRKFSKYKPQFLFAHFLSESSSIVMYSSKILNIPYGISAHAKDIFVTSSDVKEKIQTANFIAVCNENAYEYLLKKFGNLNQNIYLIHHGVDVNKIVKSVENKDYKPIKPLILSVGRLVEKKGFRYLIDAAKVLKNREIDFLVEIIGFGPLYEDLLIQIRENSLENEVKILGDNKGLSNEETLVHFKGSSVFAFPSIETEEGDVDGVANVLLEAGAFKIPVVATDAGSTKEIIIDGETGLLFPPKESVALADKLEILLSDEKLREKLGENLFNKVIEKFDINKNIVLLENRLNAGLGLEKK